MDSMNMTELEWVPNLRTKLVADDGREFENIPAWIEWFDETESKGDRLQIFRTKGYLNRRQCRSLWQWLGRTDRVPKRLDIYFKMEDLDRLYPQKPER